MRQAFYLETEPDPVFAILHRPREGGDQRTGVLLVPPFGWEEMCSYRARRAWAQAFADDGSPALRIDLPGAGDSGGYPGDPGLFEAWTSAVAGAAAWLRAETGCRRLVAIGIGLGGLIAWRAASLGAPIDDFVLWSVPARGRMLVRELKAYAAVVAARYPPEVPDPPEPPGGGMEVTGFLLSRESADALGALDLTALALPDLASRRFLLLERDGIQVDKRLAEHLESSGAEVTVAPADDYSTLMAHPQEARTPHATIARTVQWAAAANGRGPEHPPSAAPRRVATVELEAPRGGGTARESPLELSIGERTIFGIAAEPADGPRAPVCAVLLNAGAIRRTGPNRTWVELARSWAARGVCTIRVDLPGIGDSEGDERRLVETANLYSPEMTAHALAVLAALREDGWPSRFVLVGLCSGAYWAVNAAVADESVVSAMAINLYAFDWSRELVAERDRRETAAALRGEGWRKLAAGKITPQHVRRAVRSVMRPQLAIRRSGSAEERHRATVDAALDTLREREAELLLLLSSGEPMLEQFEREGRLARLREWPNVRLQRIPSTDHMARALYLQRLVAAQLDAGLERALAAETARAR